MAELVTLEEVKQGLHIDASDNDALIAFLIKAASNSVLNYLKDQADTVAPAPDSPNEGTTREEVKQATILLVGYFYKNSDGDPDKDFDMGYLPKPVMALLYPLRDPALA